MYIGSEAMWLLKRKNNIYLTTEEGPKTASAFNSFLHRFSAFLFYFKNATTAALSFPFFGSASAAT